MNYYSIPLGTKRLMNGNKIHDEVELRESIFQNIRLILKTFALSYRFDQTFGSVMNRYQACTPPQRKSERVWRENMRESIQKNIKDMLQRYETRIKVSEVNIDLKPEKSFNKDAIVNVQVQISGEVTLGRRDKFYFPDSEVDHEAQELFPLMIPMK